jgi:YesN/AraC family two-component response regulator
MKNMTFAILNDSIKELPVYVNGIGCLYEQEDIKREKGYSNYQWIQCCKGSGEVRLNGEIIKLEEGKGMLLFPNEEHKYYKLSNEWYVDWIDFNGYDIKRILTFFNCNVSSVFYISNADLIHEKIKSALEVLNSYSAYKNLECSSIVYSILLSILKDKSEEQIQKKQYTNNRLYPILKYIDNNYYNMITLEEISSIIKVTPEYLCNLFKRELDVRPIEYINSVRIKKAKELLIKDKNLKIELISSKVGFESVSYFCSIFKKKEGLSPKKFRNLYL